MLPNDEEVATAPEEEIVYEFEIGEEEEVC